MSALIESGATALDIQKQIGRESISTTFNIYGHLFGTETRTLHDGWPISTEPAKVP